jgi:hypothetical protein
MISLRVRTMKAVHDHVASSLDIPKSGTLRLKIGRCSPSHLKGTPCLSIVAIYASTRLLIRSAESEASSGDSITDCLHSQHENGQHHAAAKCFKHN